jgi:putative glutamine amidotransferase
VLEPEATRGSYHTGPKFQAMARPLIGVCAAVEPASFGPWTDEPATLLPLSYSRAIHGAGGMIALLPPDRVASESPDELLDRVDGLVLGGGSDIAPESHGAEPHPETIGWNPDRDRFEIALARRALERDLPMLGVCRGMEVLNVAAGGSLEQHLPDRLGHDRHRTVPGSWAEHEVRLESGSLIAETVGAETHTVKSHHHQGVDEVGAGFRATGWAVDEETVEAIESEDRRFAIGILWHPEEDAEDRLIPALVERAGAR